MPKNMNISNDIKTAAKEEVSAVPNMNINTSESMKKPRISDAEIDKMTKQFGNLLNDFPKVTIRLPKDPLDDSEVKEVCLNGYVYLIKRGETVEVPEPIAEILINAGLI